MRPSPSPILFQKDEGEPEGQSPRCRPVVDLKGLRGYQFKGKGELLEEGEFYNDVVCYLQTLPLKLPDPQYVVKIKVEEIYSLGLGK